MRKYFYELLFTYLSLYIFATDRLVSIFPQTGRLLNRFPRARVVTKERGAGNLGIGDGHAIRIAEIGEYDPDFILLEGTLHYERDIQALLESIARQCRRHTRLVITFYSGLWKPLIRLATFLGLRSKSPEENWLSPGDVNNLLLLGDFEAVREETRVLCPVYIPLISNFVNRYIAPLPVFRAFNLVTIVVARTVRPFAPPDQPPSVSVVVAARNEEGNIEDIVRRLPRMGPDDELILIEGHSTDGTWEKIQEVQAANGGRIIMQTARQDGRGKGDAVRKGFAMAGKDILMVLDADLTVPPEDLPKFYRAIVSGKGEFINGSRLIYPMEEKAMRLFNIIGNKFFAVAFSFLLGQRFKDTLCGTKALSRENYLKIARHRSYFGEFDPFGDFDLIFGSARMCLKIVELPISYRERTYGDTNISRWRHGLILFRMLLFAARKIKFI